MDRRPSFAELCRLLLKHAAFTVGGGSVTMIALERDIVEKEHWLSLMRYRTIYGLARVTPGTSILALATGIGWDLKQWPGALTALAITTIPGSILAAVLASAYEPVYNSVTGRKFLAGAAAAVCGLIAASIGRMLQPYRQWTSALLVAIALAMALAGVNPFLAILGFGIAGYALSHD